MSTIVLSARLIRRQWDSLVLHGHWCPGCDQLHWIAVEAPFRNGAQWTWDGNADAPTFAPSVNHGPNSKLQCHYFLKAGRIEFCGDSQHHLAGRTVDLPEIPPDWLT